MNFISIYLLFIIMFVFLHLKQKEIVCHVAASPSSQQNINGSRLESID